MKGLPARLGRYEILGDVAFGGMAEILLARVVGPSGFERPVVIKRILPHLARQESFVTMFLDEARIAASIRHHNVIHVEELEQNADDLYLVMEYLEGESVAGLMRRLFVRDDSLDRGLAAYVVAEACAGLHAAHEMTDTDGQKQNLVHRDVSPHNLFVTYDGQVKVLDFGIAKAADRITRTEVGQIKGKFEYMAPEQCNGEPLDRRADIFALGIVLYEMTTARRLFKRENAGETVRAICTHAVVPPSRVLEDYPAALECVCMRALSTSPDERYATMMEMRRDLLAALRELPGTPEPSEALARLMHTLFADRVAEKKEILRRVRSGSNVTHVPAGEIDEGVELAQVPTDPASNVEALSNVGSTVTTPMNAPRRAQPRWTYGLAALGGVMVLATGTRLSLRRASLPTPVASLAPSLPPSALPDATSVAAPLPAEVVVRVETRPADVDVLLNGKDIGSTPLDLRLSRGEEPVSLELRHAGYVSAVERVVPDHDQAIVLSLRASSPPAVRTAPASPALPASSSPWVKWH